MVSQRPEEAAPAPARRTQEGAGAQQMPTRQANRGPGRKRTAPKPIARPTPDFHVRLRERSGKRSSSANAQGERRAATVSAMRSPPASLRYLNARSRSATMRSAAEHEQPAEHDPPQPSPHLSAQSHSPRRVMRRTAHTAHAAKAASIKSVAGVMTISLIGRSSLYAAFFSAASLSEASFAL